MFYKHRSSCSKLLCKTDDFKRVKMFLKVSQISRESICIGVSFWKTRLIKKPPTQVFSCEFCKIFKNTYLEEWLTVNDCLLICFMKIRKDKKRWQLKYLSALVLLYTSQYLCLRAAPRFQISNLVRSNNKFPLNLHAEAPIKLTFIHKKEIVRHWDVKLNL